MKIDVDGHVHTHDAKFHVQGTSPDGDGEFLFTLEQPRDDDEMILMDMFFDLSLRNPEPVSLRMNMHAETQWDEIARRNIEVPNPDDVIDLSVFMR